jgi:ABC-2 type transport system ATP-binding protein
LLGAAAPRPGDGRAGETDADPLAATCGRFAAQVCAGYARAATTGRPDDALLDLLARSSPAGILDRIRAPALVIQGEADSLFPLSEGEANAAGIAATGTPVKVAWIASGHDGGVDETDRVRDLRAAWFAAHVRRDGTPTGPGFEVNVSNAAISSADTNPAAKTRTGRGVPGLPEQAALGSTELTLRGAEQVAVSPPGGTPAAITGLPLLGGGLDGLGSVLAGDVALSALPGQAAIFETEALPDGVRLAGSARVRIHVRSSARDAVLFASLVDVAPDGSQILPRRLVSPVRLDDLPPTGRAVTIALPAVVRDVAPGHRLRLVLSATDQGYALPADARAYRVSLAGRGALVLPQPDLADAGPGGVSRLWVAAGALGAAVAALLLAASVGARVAGRRRAGEARGHADAAVPLAIRGLGKTYGDGFRAVTDLEFAVPPGQVLGLLGPNGAGKTTTLRMVLGLIRPSEGEVRVFGHRVRPGAAVLSRVGAFVEGPGFLPHLTGRANLDLFWRATARPREAARMAEALEVAGLGADVDRRVKTYSHGMKQRLAIAQAMLGLPDLLVLDEPTNGLDPPQIAEMRAVLARYAATGRTVVVSSHLLAEVEQTCSHVVVMHQGRLVAHGPVAEIVGAGRAVLVDVDDADRAVAVARSLPGAQEVRLTASGIAVRLNGTPRGDLVRALVEAGLQVDRVSAQRGLEEAFLALVGED